MCLVNRVATPLLRSLPVPDRARPRGALARHCPVGPGATMTVGIQTYAPPAVRLRSASIRFPLQSSWPPPSSWSLVCTIAKGQEGQLQCCGSGSWGLLGRPVSEYGTLRQGGQRPPARRLPPEGADVDYARGPTPLCVGYAQATPGSIEQLNVRVQSFVESLL